MLLLVGGARIRRRAFIRWLEGMGRGRRLACEEKLRNMRSERSPRPAHFDGPPAAERRRNKWPARASPASGRKQRRRRRALINAQQSCSSIRGRRRTGATSGRRSGSRSGSLNELSGQRATCAALGPGRSRPPPSEIIKSRRGTLANNWNKWPADSMTIVAARSCGADNYAGKVIKIWIQRARESLSPPEIRPRDLLEIKFGRGMLSSGGHLALRGQQQPVLQPPPGHLPDLEAPAPSLRLGAPVRGGRATGGGAMRPEISSFRMQQY